MCVHNKGIFRQVQMFYCCYRFAFLFLYFSGLSLHAAHAGLHIHGLFLAFCNAIYADACRHKEVTKLTFYSRKKYVLNQLILHL